MADRKPLNVINPNDKVRELRDAFASNPLSEPAPLVPGVAGEPSDLQSTIIDALRTIYDPEIPVNIYDLGLIYAIDVDAEAKVKVTMTLTAPACPVAGQIVADVEKKVREVEGVKSSSVDLVFEPAWTKERMSEAALLELGLM
jgi:FeS assembly SUF system protein